MKEIKDESVHLVVTSPPYWQLKDYGADNQIGFDNSYEDYINNLSLVWQECRRVLHGSCRLCINVGDQFARAAYYGRYKVVPIRTEIIKFCESAGFDYMGAIIWRKVTTCNTSGGGTVMGSFPYPRNGILKLDYEFILIFKKHGTAPPVAPELKEQSRLSTEEWNSYFSGHWQIPGEKQDRHLAAFPEELPRRLIKMFSFAGDTVLDPFLGSGTTTLAAGKLNRNSTGYEINKAYLPLIREKVSFNQPGLDSEIIFETANRPGLDFAAALEKLPYRFRDPLPFNRKADPKENSHGSKIDHSDRDRSVYCTVKEVISPVTIRLSDGRTISLLGVQENSKKTGEAISYLREKTRGQKVFTRTDQENPGADGNIPVYLYLKNKTFINAHLIRRGLAHADPAIAHRYRKKFLSLDTSSNR